MKDAIIRLVSSMKVWTAVLGLLTAVGAKYGLNVDPEVYWAIVGVITALILGQGLTDHGKEAAKIATGIVTTNNANSALDKGQTK